MIPTPLPEYLQALRRICDDNSWLLMLDEVQTGIARTGTWFAHQHSNIKPDVMTLAKGLGSGVPIGACLASGLAAGLFKPGNHGSTFGGNPLACTAGLTTLQAIEEEGLLEHAVTIGQFIVDGFNMSLEGTAGVTQIRGLGMMIGIELDRPCGELVKIALEQGLLINVTGDKVIRIIPPLVMNQEEATQLIAILSPLIVTFLTTD